MFYPCRPTVYAALIAAMAITAVALTSGDADAQSAPTIRRINPPGLSKPTGYTHVVDVVGGRTVYISGQVALDSTGALIGPGDFAAQTEQVFANLRRALAAAGASFSDVVKLTILSTDASKVGIVRTVRDKYIDAAQVPASTFLEVRGLARADWLIEIEAIAVVR
jgi:2-iminobutanoate/2-iminopropanoate deaminase